MKTRKMNVGFPAKMALVVLLLVAPAVMMWGCGKKGSPKPPTGSRPPRIGDLRYGVSNNTVKLSWTVPEPDEKAQLPIAGFLIYRYQQSAAERECPNCPIIFKLIGDVPVRSPDSGQSAPLIMFTQTIEPGYRYTYKVNGYSEGGIRSRNSNFAQFIF